MKILKNFKKFFTRLNVKKVKCKFLLVLFSCVIAFASGYIVTALYKRHVIQKTIEEMSLEEKVGQLFMFGFLGTEPDYYITEMIKERNVGGVILMAYNIESGDQLVTLTSSLQEMSKYPLFVGIDQEGGGVSRITFENLDNISQDEIKEKNLMLTKLLMREEKC